MKQTSIEWLANWMKNNQYFIGNDLLQAIEESKEMHKEEIVLAAARGYLVGEDDISFKDAKLYGRSEERRVGKECRL